MRKYILSLCFLFLYLTCYAQLGIVRKEVPEDLHFSPVTIAYTSPRNLNMIINGRVDKNQVYIAPFQLMRMQAPGSSEICYFIQMELAKEKSMEKLLIHLGSTKESALASLDDFLYLFTLPLSSEVELENAGNKLVVRVFKVAGLITRYADERSRPEILLGIRRSGAADGMVEAKLTLKGVQKFKKELEKYAEK